MLSACARVHSGAVMAMPRAHARGANPRPRLVVTRTRTMHSLAMAWCVMHPARVLLPDRSKPKAEILASLTLSSPLLSLLLTCPRLQPTAAGSECREPVHQDAAARTSVFMTDAAQRPRREPNRAHSGIRMSTLRAPHLHLPHPATTHT